MDSSAITMDNVVSAYLGKYSICVLSNRVVPLNLFYQSYPDMWEVAHPRYTLRIAYSLLRV